MPVKYLICVDFATTCAARSSINWFPEVIEFAAVILNLNTGRCEETFHYYVRPTHFPILSLHCMQKLHITQSQVSSGDYLYHVLDDFDLWSAEMCYEREVIFPSSSDLCPESDYMVICTWSNDDLPNFLRTECYHKDIDIPDVLEYWVDAQRAALNQGFCEDFDQTMLQLGVERVGWPHSSIGDAQSLTRLAFTLDQQFGENFDDIEEMNQFILLI